MFEDIKYKQAAMLSDENIGTNINEMEKAQLQLHGGVWQMKKYRKLMYKTWENIHPNMKSHHFAAILAGYWASALDDNDEKQTLKNNIINYCQRFNVPDVFTSSAIDAVDNGYPEEIDNMY
ncbi:MAG: hypothetical protein OEQ39_23575 [Gammaproteobacteria bacterium]|nr:hypothetical protein [Gammaproteobacteria bacterium]MDH3467157.1 hypothetical protein [Gammaproteobacteria bacterium]